MFGEAVAAGTTRPAAATRIAAQTPNRSDTGRLPPVRRQHPAQSLLQLDLGFPAEQLPGASDVGLAYLGIVDRQCLEDDLALRVRHLEEVLRELEDRELARVADVDGEVLTALGKQEDPADQVVHVAEAPRLRAV